MQFEVNTMFAETLRKSFAILDMYRLTKNFFLFRLPFAGTNFNDIESSLKLC